ncbi:hypothetical protein AB1Y20_007349 [Prymnesium parvum]|uniref:peptidylprolyl isomerase n=1 Tax=Prymnesium parvum TaxID=97485 RepID=A0AB34IV13_PRYPA
MLAVASRLSLAWAPLASLVHERRASPSRGTARVHMALGWKTTPSGLRYAEVSVGEGAQPMPGTLVKVHYTGEIEGTGEVYMASRGERSLTNDQPFVFRVGSSAVIRGLDEGVSTMRVGGRRRLSIPPALAYGEQGYLSGIAVRVPPNARLLIECELVGFSDGREWTRDLFRTENAGPWAVLLITFAFLGAAAAPEGTLPKQVTDLLPLVLGDKFSR